MLFPYYEWQSQNSFNYYHYTAEVEKNIWSFKKKIHYTFVLVRVSIPAQTSWPRNKLGEERVYWAYISTLQFITKGSEDWNSSRSGSRSWCRGHGGMFLTGLLPLACSACCLIEPKSTSPKVVPPTRGPPLLITNWENVPQLDLMEALPQLKLLSLW